MNNKLGRLRIATLDSMTNDAIEWRTLILRYAKRCYVCDVEIAKGNRAMWNPSDSLIKHTNDELCLSALEATQKKRRKKK